MITSIVSVQLAARKEKKRNMGLTMRLPNSAVSLRISRLWSILVIESNIFVSKKAHRGSENRLVLKLCFRLSTYSICMDKKIHYINYANTHSCQLLSKNSITNIVQTWNNCKTKTELVATTGQHSCNKKIASIMYGEYMFQQLLYGQIATTKLNQLQCED